MKGKGIAVTALLLLSIILATAIPVAAARYELKATPENLNLLYTYTYGGSKNDAWYSYGYGVSPYLLKYYYGKTLNTYGKSKTSVPVDSITAIKIWDGECVAFAKSMSNTNTITTSHWRKGKKVVDPSSNIQRGTIVANFNVDGTYDCCYRTGHVAIFDQYFVTNNGVGFKVWDQNYVKSNLVGRHTMMPSGSGLYNANNYYVVEIEP